MAGLQRFLVAARDIKTPQGPPPFAFKLHQFISDEAAFYNLLSLLDPAFLGLQSRASADDPLRQQLARHLVQRRRKDIVEWQTETQDGRGFARRIKTVLTYKLTGDWGAFF